MQTMIHPAAIVMAIGLGIFLAGLAWSWTSYTNQPRVHGENVFDSNDFFDSGMNKTDRPIELAGNNFIWPDGWTVEMAKKWRAEHGASVR